MLALVRWYHLDPRGRKSRRMIVPARHSDCISVVCRTSFVSQIDSPLTFIAFESFPRYWSSRWFDNRSHTFDWGVYLARRFGMFTENASTKSQMTQSIDAAVALNVGRFHVTDQIGRYDRLPTYWEELVHYIADKNEQRRQTVVEAGAL